jgi:hypothetical protein
MNKVSAQQCQLQDYLGNLASSLPEGDQSFLFESRLFPLLPNILQTPNIEVCKTYHFIGDSCRIDVLNFIAPRHTYTCWALAILAVIFRLDLPELMIQLTAPSSQVKQIHFGYSGTTTRSALTYLTAPHSFEYRRLDINEHPWTQRRIPDNGWPDFLLKYSGSAAHDHWEARDTIEGFGNDDASVLLAELLLNFGSTKNRQLMVRLETVFSPAYRGVSALSPEVRLHLPGSEGWPR